MNMIEASMVHVLSHFGRHTKIPFLRRMESMPLEMLYKSAKRYLSDSSFNISEDGENFVISFPLKKFQQEAERTEKLDRHSVVAELLTFNASKSVIQEITGLSHPKIEGIKIDMGLSAAKIGRPTKFTEAEKHLIINYWNQYSNEPEYKVLIRTATFLDYSVNDVWSVVQCQKQQQNEVKKHAS